jgi:hypothetical protein
MSRFGPSLPFVALQRDVGNAGMSGLKADIANVTRLTHQRHWVCTAALALMPVSAPTKVLV